MPQVRYLKPLGPYAVDDVRDVSEYEADQLIMHGVAIRADDEVRHATAEPHKKRTATKRHAEG